MSYDSSMIGDLKRRRQAMRASVKEVSDNSGIDETLLNNWECGVGVPRLDAIEGWAAALGLRVAVLPANSGAVSELRLNRTERNATIGDVAVPLTPMEWKLLERLARLPGDLVTHRELFHHLYGEERLYCAKSTGIRVMITRLRRLLRVQIVAKWGRGYVISGIEPSTPRATLVRRAANDDPVHVEERQPEKRQADRAPIRREPAAPGETKTRHFAVPAPPRHQQRTEELEMLQQFLAQRGPTLCPDLATMQKSPLPPLAWDKAKRKWARSATEREPNRLIVVVAPE